jgi:hypothetical protein
MILIQVQLALQENFVCRSRPQQADRVRDSTLTTRTHSSLLCQIDPSSFRSSLSGDDDVTTLCFQYAIGDCKYQRSGEAPNTMSGGISSKLGHLHKRPNRVRGCQMDGPQRV